MSHPSLQNVGNSSEHPISSILIALGLIAIAGVSLVVATFGTMFVIAVCQSGACF